MKMKARDAKRAMTFWITKKHVAAAVCKDPEKCVIAQALQAAFPDYIKTVYVGPSIVKLIMLDDTAVRYATPKPLKLALKKFDQLGGWDLAPGRYKLLPPAPSARLGAHAPRPRGNLPERKGLKATARALMNTRIIPRISALS